MIHHLNALTLTEKLREPLQDSGDDLQFAAVEANLAEYANNCASWHWHEFVELAYVERGALECCTPLRTFVLSEGEGYFINANVLHLHRMTGTEATLRIVQFIPSLLAGSRSIYESYIGPIEKCARLDALPLAPEAEGEERLLSELHNIFTLAEKEGEGFELRIMERLYGLWGYLYGLAKPMFESQSGFSNPYDDRVKSMLTFIHAHYAEPIGVSDIASAANISQREAFRSFRQVLDITPTLYLLRHRVNNAARLLVETRKPVTEIALSCGFSSPSYMCKAFRDINGISPRAFRNKTSR